MSRRSIGARPFAARPQASGSNDRKKRVFAVGESARETVVSGAIATYPGVEPQVGRLVADHLGVGLEDLGRHTSLRDDLAADSLDMLELGMALESRFGIDVPDRVLARVRSYGELVEATVRLLRKRR
jgi:acyl carrier protein